MESSFEVFDDFVSCSSTSSENIGMESWEERDNNVKMSYRLESRTFQP